MRSIQLLCMVLTQFSTGTLLFTSILPPRVIRTSFFTFNALMAALAAAGALALSKTLLHAAWWDIRYLGLTVITATIAWGCFRLEFLSFGRMALVVAGMLGLVFGVLPLADSALQMRQIDTPEVWMLSLGVLAGT